MKRQYNLKPDKLDIRDKLFAPKASSTLSLPKEIDLRPYLLPVVDQGSLGSCTSNAIASGLREYQLIKDDRPLTRLSRLFHYYHERLLEGTVNEDSGAYIRDGMKVLQQIGCAPEMDWPYVEAKFREKPSDHAESRAAAYKIAEYHRVMSYDDLLVALAQEQPVVLGISVYQSFESGDVATRGMVPVPKPTEQFLGGHAVLAVGYKTFADGLQYVLVRNSWGTNWGQFGYCWIPKDFFIQGFVSDMWTGTAELKPENLTFEESLNIIIKEKQILNGFEYWKNYEVKLNAGTLTYEDYKFIPLVFQKFAAYLKNNQ